MIDKIGLIILTMFGIGNIKYAPGSVASFVTCLFFYVLANNETIGDYGLFYSYDYFLIIFIFIFLIYSIILIDKLSSHFKKKDPKEIVIDEFFGQLIPLIFIFYSGHYTINTDLFFYPELRGPKLIWIFLAFILFRFFDIYKIFPINIVDKKMKNGLGIILDDILAGIYATITIVILLKLLT